MKNQKGAVLIVTAFVVFFVFAVNPVSVCQDKQTDKPVVSQKVDKITTIEKAKKTTVGKAKIASKPSYSGQKILTGERGGRYHWSATGKKVYEKSGSKRSYSTSRRSSYHSRRK